VNSSFGKLQKLI